VVDTLIAHLEKELSKLLKNRIEGSIGLLQKFFEIIIDHSTNKDHCIHALDRFIEEYSDMLVITRFNNSFDNISHNQIVKDSRDNLKDIKNFMDKISKAFIREINNATNTFLVYSNSKTIQFTLQNIPDKLIEKIYVMQSNPGGEGLSLFSALGDADNLRSKIELIDDDRGFALIDQQKINYVLLGCDQYHDNWFVNKIGSGKLIKEAVKHHVSVIVLTQNWKKSLSANHPNIKSELLELVNIVDEINIITD
jgi:translation initiation factor 2B subunit (eIF-2B alpha/beta/delta family)